MQQRRPNRILIRNNHVVPAGTSMKIRADDQQRSVAIGKYDVSWLFMVTYLETASRLLGNRIDGT